MSKLNNLKLNILKAKQVRPRLSPERYESFLQWEKRVAEGLDGDSELIEENVKLAKQKQRLQDMNRIERKSWREQTRYENAVSAYGKSLVEEMQKYGKGLADKINLNPLVKKDGNDIWGVIHISDTHFNELINLPHNQYNWTVASKRLKLQIDESLKYFEFKKVNKVLFACSGDLVNSNRRMDELLNQSTNRAKASVLAAHLLTQAVLDVRNRGFMIDVVSVTGNESRIEKEMGFSDASLSDNFDVVVMSMVKICIDAMPIDGINFISIDKSEAVVDFGEQCWLVTHDIGRITDKQASTQSTFGRYLGRGVKLDFIISGHIHSHRGTDLSCRSGSMAGSNSYNEVALNLIGRASGVCYVVDGKTRAYQYIDLQHAENEGYEIESKLEAYHAKSESKLTPETTVFKVVI